MTHRTLIALIAIAGTALAAGTASARDAAKPAPQLLPGVDGGYGIVKPLPEPDESADAANGAFKVGNTEVRISGYVRVDIGAGTLQRPRH